MFTELKQKILQWWNRTKSVNLGSKLQTRPLWHSPSSLEASCPTWQLSIVHLGYPLVVTWELSIQTASGWWAAFIGYTALAPGQHFGLHSPPSLWSGHTGQQALLLSVLLTPLPPGQLLWWEKAAALRESLGDPRVTWGKDFSSRTCSLSVRVFSLGRQDV